MRSPIARRLLIALGGLLLVLVLAAIALVASFDAERYKALAVAWMKTEHQRTLRIDGPVALSVFPRLALEVSRLSLSEPGREDEFAAVEEASVSLRLLPLLRSELVVDRVQARGVRARLLRDAQGRRNVDDLLAGGSTKPAPGAPPSRSAPLRIDISAVQFDDLRLHLQDDLAPLAGEVVLQRLSAGRIADQAETPVAVRASVQLTQPRPAKLALDGRMTLRLDLARQAFALSALKLDVEGEGAGVRALALAVEGALAWDGHALRAGPLQVALKSASLGSVALAPSTLAVRQALFSPGEQRLELDALVLALAGRQGEQAFELGLDWPQLAVGAQQLQGSALSGRVRFAGPAALAGEFRSGEPSGRFDAVRLPGVVLTLAGSVGPRQVDARLNAALLLDAARSAATIDGLDLRATLTEPGAPPLALSLQGQGHASAQAADARLTGALNANRFELEAGARLDGPRPRLKAAARFDSLDLNSLLAPGKAAPVAGAPADTPLPLDALKAVDGQFTLDAGALVWQQLRVADARLAATLDGGTLRVTRLAGRAWGGRIEGSGSADAASQRMALKLDARAVDVDALLKAVAGKDLLEGRGDVTADLASSGASVAALRSHLSGRVALQLRDGAIKGYNLARTLRQAKAALSLKQDAVAQSRSVEKTDFSELHASARIADGVAHSDDLDLKSPFLRLGGAGSLDIGRGRIAYTARATVTDTAAGQGGAELAALRGVTVPVHLSGPLDAIEWKVQWSGVASAALKSRLKDKLGEALGGRLGGAPAPAGTASAPKKPEDLLKDRLKRLLK